MQSLAIVDLFDELSDRATCSGSIPISLPVDFLVLERLHEALCLGIVVRIADAAHARLDVVHAQLQTRREDILAAGAADFRRFADALDGVAAHGRVVMLGSEQAIAAATAERADVEMTRVL